MESNDVKTGATLAVALSGVLAFGSIFTGAVWLLSLAYAFATVAFWLYAGQDNQ